jgi:hypothetical protein
MKSLLIAAALAAGAVMLADTAVAPWAGSSIAVAQTRSSACYQNCTNVRRWPAAQCRAYCQGKSRR